MSFNLISEPNAPTIDLEDSQVCPTLVNQITTLVDEIEYQSRKVDSTTVEGAVAAPPLYNRALNYRLHCILCNHFLRLY
jgi:hypothetical protein